MVERSPRAEHGQALRERTHSEGLGEALGRLQNPEAVWEGLSFDQAVEVKPGGKGSECATILPEKLGKKLMLDSF